jgi:hypothetical protein
MVRAHVARVSALRAIARHVALTATLAGCAGPATEALTLGDATALTSDAATGVDTTADAAAAEDTRPAAPEPPPDPPATRRLTRREYMNSLLAVVPPIKMSAMSSSFWRVPVDVSKDGFDTMDTRVGSEHVEAWFRVGEAAARLYATTVTPTLIAAGTCDGAASCVATLAERLAPLTIREEPAAEDLAAWEGDFAAAAGSDEDSANEDTAMGVEAVVFAMLSDPRFLYRFELDVPQEAGAATIPLSAREFVSRVTFALTGAPPSSDLLATAAAGLTTDTERLELARALYATPAGKETIWEFFNGWLGLSRIPSLQYPNEFYPLDNIGGLRDAMLEELRALLEHFAFEVPNAGYADLMTTPSTYKVTGKQIALYGAPESTPKGVPVELDAATRSGILTRTAMLVQVGEFTSPMRRGSFVLRRLLCTDIAQPPPSEIDPTKLAAPWPNAALTARDRWTATTDQPSCIGCHTLFNGFGFALEKYDALGRRRETEYTASVMSTAGKHLPIDDTVTMTLDGKKVTFTGAVGLGKVLATSATAQRCLARQWFRFTMGRRETEADASSLDLLVDALERGGLAEMFVAIVTTPSFQQRLAPTPMPEPP